MLSFLLMKSKVIIAAILIICLGFVCQRTIAWQSRNADFARGFDQMVTVTNSTQAYLELTRGSYQFFYPKGFREVNRRPPLAFYAAALQMILFGADFFRMALTNLWFYFAIAVALFILARRRGGDWVGLAAVGILLIGNGFTLYLLTWNTDLAATAAVAWTMVLLDDTRIAGNKKLLAALGLTIYIGLMTRLTYPLFVVLPLAWVFGTNFAARKRVGGFARALRFSLNGLIPLFVVFVGNTLYGDTYRLVEEFGSEKERFGDQYLPFKTLTGDWFFQDWYKGQGPLFILITIVALGFFLKHRRSSDLPILLWLLIPLAGFALFSVNALRLSLPAWPAVVVLFATALGDLSRRWKIVIALCLVAAGGAIFFKATANDQFTRPPVIGAGWANYDASDREVMEYIGDDDAPILVIDQFDYREYVQLMLPAAIILKNPNRPYGYFEFYDYVKYIGPRLENILSDLDQYRYVLLKQKTDATLLLDKSYWSDYYFETRMLGATDEEFAGVMDGIEKLMNFVSTGRQVFDQKYDYGEFKYRLRLFEMGM